MKQVLWFLAAALQFAGFARADFTMSFSTAAPGGGDAPKNLLAVWVEDEDENFVKTIARYARHEGDRAVPWKLYQWWVVSGSSAGTVDVDAWMGATRPNHETPDPVVATWDLTDRSGAVVPDGNYVIKFELNDSAPVHYHSFTFVKDQVAGVRTNAGSECILNISIDYDPMIPEILTQPEDLSLLVGEDAEFHVGASGTNLTYQWFFAGSAIAAGTNESLRVEDVGLVDAGAYQVVVSNAYGAVASDSASLQVALPEVGVGIAMHVGLHLTNLTVGADYSVQASSALTPETNWIEVGTFQAAATNAVWFDPDPAVPSEKFYQVKSVQAE